MQIVVLGAGAIGSVYGAKLSTAHDVVLVARPAHADAINRDGLHVIGAEDRVYPVRAVTQLNRLPENALIVLTCKVSDTEAALSGVRHLTNEDTTVLCVQNGLYSENVANSVLGDRCVVLRAIPHFGAIFRAPGAGELKVG